MSSRFLRSDSFADTAAPFLGPPPPPEAGAPFLAAPFLAARGTRGISSPSSSLSLSDSFSNVSSIFLRPLEGRAQPFLYFSELDPPYRERPKRRFVSTPLCLALHLGIHVHLGFDARKLEPRGELSQESRWIFGLGEAVHHRFGDANPDVGRRALEPGRHVELT